MALRFLGLLVVVLAIGFVSCDEGVQLEADGNAGKFWSELEQSKVALLKEVSELKSQVSILESNLKDVKRESIEKSRKIVSMEGELESFQKRNGGDLESKLQHSEGKLEETVKKVHRLEETVKHYEKLVKESERRVASLESKNAELASQNGKLEKTVSELQKKLRDAEEALRIAEAAMLKAQSEAASKSQELYKMYEAWLPPWAASRLAQAQATSMTYWASHGDPLMKTASAHVSRHTETAKKWTEPHFKTFREKVAPVVSQYWERVSQAAVANSGIVVSKLREGYEAARLHTSPHWVKAKKHVGPYIQTVKGKARPYVDQAAFHIRPWYQKGQAALEPHIEKGRRLYQGGATHFYSSQQQVKKSLRSTLMRHQVSAAFAASEEILSFLAMALIVLPIVGGVLFVSSLFRGKRPAKSPVRGASTGNGSSKKHYRRANKV